MKAAWLLLLCVVSAAVVVRAADVDVEGESESQAELDAAHENAVATLEEYAEKAHALRDEIVSTEQSLMEQAAAIDTCPAGELAGLMARAKQQIAHLLQVKALYLAIKQQETQLRALVNAGTGKRAPTVAPKPAAIKPVVPAKPKAAAVAKPTVKPAAAAAKPLDSASFAKLSAMNAKLHNALARLESVTARLAKVEKRQDSSKKATLLIAGQMEKDEKRLNKHSRVLRRVRKGVHGIKSRLSRLEQSLVRGKAAIAVIDKKHRKHHKHGKHAKKHGKHGRKHRKHGKHAKKHGKKHGKHAKKHGKKHGKHGKKHSKHSKKVSKKHAKGRRHPRRGGRGARKLAPLKKQHKKAFNVAKCYKSCGAKKGKAQKKCLRRCQRKARASGKGKEARPKALRVCLKKCRAASKKGGKKSRGAAKKCALSCFRRHAKKRASKKGGKKNAQLLMCSRACKQIKSLPAKKGKGKRASKAAVKKAKAKCHRDCKKRYGRSGKGKKGKKHAKKAKKFDVKKCLKKCPRSKKHPKRASKRCASKCHTKARAKKGLKTAKNPKLKTCFKTCRAGRKWNMSCVKSCRARFGAKAKAHKKAKRANKKLIKQCFKTCKGKAHYVVRGKGKHARKVRVAGKWDMKCVKSCRKRFGKKAKKHSKKPKVSAALKKCYKTCRGPARVVVRGVGKKAHRTTVRGAYNKACVSRCQKKFGKKAKKAHAPPTAAYKACLARCRPGKAFKKCKKACKKHNKSRKIKVVSPSAKLVKDALKSLKKPKKVKRHSRPETWDDVVRDSRRLLKKTVRLRHLIHKQTARYQDKKDVEGRKYNGWWSIWDVLKGVKPGKHYTGRAKQIAADVKQIMAPRLAKAADGPYGEIVNVLAGADTAFGSKYTRELGSPSLDLTVDPKFDGYVEKPLPGAKIRHVPYNPKKPYDSNKLYKRSPPLSRLPEIVEEDYNSNLKPMYVKDFHVVPRKAARPSQPFNLKTKNWDYPQIPYSYPVTMVKHDPKANNPHVHAPKPGFHREWPEFSHIETAAGAGAAAAAPAPVQAQAQAPMTAPVPAAAQEAPMTEGTAF